VVNKSSELRLLNILRFTAIDLTMAVMLNYSSLVILNLDTSIYIFNSRDKIAAAHALNKTNVHGNDPIEMIKY